MAMTHSRGADRTQARVVDPGRPTTRDLARAAGVSLATVDRVLNGRDGVREATVKRVHAAISELGFVRNIAAANLAKRRSYRFLFVLPQTGDQFLAEVSRHIRDGAAAFAADRVEVEIRRVDANDPHRLAVEVGALAGERWDGVTIMAPRSPQLRHAMAKLAEHGVNVLPFVTGQDDGGDFVGIDNRAAGATAGLLMGRFAGGAPGQVLVLTETIAAQESIDRRRGFDEMLEARFPALTALPSLESYGSAERTRTVLGNALSRQRGLRGLYILASEARLALEALRRLPAPPGLVTIAHERTEASIAALLDGTADAIITQDPGHLARSALRRLKAHCDGHAIVPSQERIRTEILLPTNI
jgi:LacI family transcriptional regulator